MKRLPAKPKSSSRTWTDIFSPRRSRSPIAAKSGPSGCSPARAPEALAAAGVAEIPSEPHTIAPAAIAGQQVWIRRTSMAGPVGFLIDGPREAKAAIGAALVAAGARGIDHAAWDARRIEWGWPLQGLDITEKNLPQEVDRDRLAISFVKGCYLGQETVARIDALGHVNRTLAGVCFLAAQPGAPLPAPGLELTRDGKPAGHVTSSCYSPTLAAPLALAYLRRECNAPGTEFDSPLGAARAVRLPLDLVSG